MEMVSRRPGSDFLDNNQYPVHVLLEMTHKSKGRIFSAKQTEFRPVASRVGRENIKSQRQSILTEA